MAKSICPFCKGKKCEVCNMSGIHHVGTSQIVCPYCGDRNAYQSEDPEETVGHATCKSDRCGKKFHFEGELIITWSTTRVPCLNGVPHDLVHMASIGSKVCRVCGDRQPDKSCPEARARP